MNKAIVTPQAPLPAGPYSPAILSGDFIFCAGQGPLEPGRTTVIEGDLRAQTRRVLENLKAVLEAAGSSLAGVVKCNVYLADIADFGVMNEVYADYFRAPFPARTTIQVGALPMGIRIEIDCIARR
jgi:2-iminobutanoate/2-iminopropanoate deaminase